MVDSKPQNKKIIIIIIVIILIVIVSYIIYSSIKKKDTNETTKQIETILDKYTNPQTIDQFNQEQLDYATYNVAKKQQILDDQKAKNIIAQQELRSEFDKTQTEILSLQKELKDTPEYSYFQHKKLTTDIQIKEQYGRDVQALMQKLTKDEIDTQTQIDKDKIEEQKQIALQKEIDKLAKIEADKIKIIALRKDLQILIREKQNFIANPIINDRYYSEYCQQYLYNVTQEKKYRQPIGSILFSLLPLSINNLNVFVLNGTVLQPLTIIQQTIAPEYKANFPPDFIAPKIQQKLSNGKFVYNIIQGNKEAILSDISYYTNNSNLDQKIVMNKMISHNHTVTSDNASTVKFEGGNSHTCFKQASGTQQTSEPTSKHMTSITVDTQQKCNAYFFYLIIGYEQQINTFQMAQNDQYQNKETLIWEL